MGARASAMSSAPAQAGDTALFRQGVVLAGAWPRPPPRRAPSPKLPARSPAEASRLGTELLIAVGLEPSLTPAVVGDPAIVARLIAAGADVDKEYVYETALMHCVRIGRSDLVELLLAGGADVDKRDSILGETPLFSAVCRREGHLMARLLAAGADPNAAGPRNYTPLWVAARRGDVYVVEALLAAGADPAFTTVRAGCCQRGDSAFSAATRNGHTRVVEMMHEWQLREQARRRLEEGHAAAALGADSATAAAGAVGGDAVVGAPPPPPVHCARCAAPLDAPGRCAACPTAHPPSDMQLPFTAGMRKELAASRL